MKRLCKKYGCNLQHQQDHHDAIVQFCKDCGKKYIFNKASDGTFDKRAYGKANKRATIQPTDKQAWHECYGHTKYGGILEGKVLDDEVITNEELKVFRKDKLKIEKEEHEQRQVEQDQYQSAYKK